jgi:hypothetical protein
MTKEETAPKFRVEKFVLLATCFTLVSCLAYSLTPHIKAAGFYETSLDVHENVWRYEPLTAVRTSNLIFLLKFSDERDASIFRVFIRCPLP